jgi:uncharacterized protein (TIRG00374 family)
MSEGANEKDEAGTKRNSRFEETKEELALIRKQRKQQNRAKLIFSAIILVCLTVMVISLFLNFGDIKQMSATFQSVANGNNWVYLFVAFIMIVIYLVLWPLSLYVFCHALKIEASFRDVCEIGEAEHFYNGVTPFATGGQPFQVYFFRNIGVSTAQSTGAVLATFGTYLLVTNIYAILALCFYPFYVQGLAQGALKDLEWMNVTAFAIISGIGYFFNLLTMIFTFLVGANNKTKNVIVALMSKLCRISFLKKKLEKQIPVFTAYCDNTQAGFHEILSHKHHFWLSFIIRFVAVGCFYAIPFFILKAFGAQFGNDVLAFWVVFFSTSFAITAVVWVPTPGSTGGVEYMFAIVIGSVVAGGFLVGGTENISAFATSLLWRMFTYYFPLLVSFIVSAIFEIRVAKRMRQSTRILDEKERSLQPEPAGEKPQEK